MKIIPAVDIKEGRCVRLSQGKADQETVYSDDPVAMACHWDEEGAPLIHVVDLDGAFDGQPANAETVKQIIYNSSVDIQVGGGIRNLKTIEAYIKAGAFRVILGTIAQKEPEFVAEACREFPGKIIVGIDARDGNVAIKGWVEVSDQRATDLAQKLESYGVAGYIFTDISRDGMLQGPNLKSIKEFTDSTERPVIASGGVSKLSDIEDLLALEPNGVEGIITGKALYDKSFTYPQTLELLNHHAG
ncbi:MAG TPA: 1-(5-phosphoribosyl)-5-[(5-phosphoribosylamino)methylideneamino]imidazole-4-carboxamide isomerase [Nitrospinaceae bacterium]|jgi:phosphoribosylformimino-5-aminoimidazole carboxamide ribotide isomerase|nr:1-(5-phosphoribosyl)-5-[(5-phosphoribosylamino)methylideneamino]imidazole-4-carboxamide isomerase [Nitrospinaceae bacterium]HJN99230.1 1-(5-phosphoribosyl)-5-[(5-phosphoribosylamino)methylideneamino]imidazole-4-carboxamide isomerase [Nitrospinaceae bacterium]|tara:strand:+ start:1401 stop:2135 length:735 start_codon:yes stop_codon:yes gene_type:complete